MREQIHLYLSFRFSITQFCSKSVRNRPCLNVKPQSLPDPFPVDLVEKCVPRNRKVRVPTRVLTLFFRKSLKICSGSNLLFRGLTFDFYPSSIRFLCEKEGKLHHRTQKGKGYQKRDRLLLVSKVEVFTFLSGIKIFLLIQFCQSGLILSKKCQS